MPDGMTHADRVEAGASTPPPRAAVILAGHLLRAARIAAAVTERRNTIPILANLHLQVEGGALAVMGTDMEMLAATGAPVVGALDATTVSGAALVALLTRLPAETEITLERDARDVDLGRLRLSAPRLRASLIALPAEDFPRMDILWKPVATFGIPAASLRRLLVLTAHAISTEETRYYLNGVHLAPRGSGESAILSATATDGHRLIRVDEPLPAGAEHLPGIIVPRKAVARLRALLDAHATGEVQVEASATKIRFVVGKVTLTTKLIDGTFPDVERVIPKPDAATATMRVHQPARFRDAIETASAISTERSRPVKFTGEKGSIFITAHEPDGGETQVDLSEEVATWEGRAAEIGFQTRYLAALAKILPEGFTAGIEAGGAPMRIDFPRGVAVLMPMRV